MKSSCNGLAWDLTRLKHRIVLNIINFEPDQVRKVAEENGVDVSEQVKELEARAKQVGRTAHPFQFCTSCHSSCISSSINRDNSVSSGGK